MKSKIFLTLLTFLSITTTGFSLQVTEDEHYTYTQKSWGEITSDAQRLLIRHFSAKLSTELSELHIPTFWNTDADNALTGNQQKFTATQADTQVQATTFASGHSIQLEGLLPTGFILGIGVSGSGTLVVGVAQSALLTLIVVPYEIVTTDKTTGETSVVYQASWAVGGLGQASVGAGAGGGITVRGAIGLIWGEIPDASLIQGTAIGASGNITLVQGLGFKAAILLNSATHEYNVFAMATYDMGIAVEADISASTYYFMNATEVIEFMSGLNLNTMSGSEIVNSDQLAKQS